MFCSLFAFDRYVWYILFFACEQHVDCFGKEYVAVHSWLAFIWLLKQNCTSWESRLEQFHTDCRDMTTGALSYNMFFGPIRARWVPFVSQRIRAMNFALGACLRWYQPHVCNYSGGRPLLRSSVNKTKPMIDRQKHQAVFKTRPNCFKPRTVEIS